MTEPTPENESVDFSALRAEDAPPIVTPRVPDHTASRERRRGWGRAKEQREAPRARTREREPRAKAAKPTIPNRKGQFVEPLEQFYTAIGVSLLPFDAVCANSVIAAAPNCAQTLDELAYRNASFRRIIFALVNTSAVGAVIAAHVPILLAIAMHHVPAVQNALGVRGMEFAANFSGTDVPPTPPTPEEGQSDAA